MLRLYRTFVINDVTDRERRKERLEDRNQEIDLLRQVQSRIIRHNIRNDLVVIRGRIEEVAAQIDDEAAVEDIFEASDDLLSISQKTRLVEQVVDRTEPTIECDLRELVDETVSNITSRYPAVDMHVTGPETSLEHGSGIGLWLVKWITDRSNIELEFETDPGRTEVTLRFGTKPDQERTTRAPEAIRQ